MKTKKKKKEKTTFIPQIKTKEHIPSFWVKGSVDLLLNKFRFSFIIEIDHTFLMNRRDR